jgi:hypothetical protein
VVSKQPLSIPKNRSGTLHVHRWAF